MLCLVLFIEDNTMKNKEVICIIETQIIFNKKLYELKVIPKELFEIVYDNLNNKLNDLCKG